MPAWYEKAARAISLREPDFAREFFSTLSQQQWVMVTIDGLPYPVLGRFGTTADGRRICTGLVLGAASAAAEITSTNIREIPLAHVLALANRAESLLNVMLGEGRGCRSDTDRQGRDRGGTLTSTTTV